MARWRRAGMTGLIAMTILSTVLLCAGTPASADGAAEFCTLQLPSGSFTCTSSPALASRMIAAVTDGSQVVLGRFYDDPYKQLTDGWFQVTATSGCDTGTNWELGVMPSGWNDRISSFRAYASCDIRLYWDGGLTGPVYGPSTGANTLGSFDNQTSSIGFS